MFCLHREGRIDTHTHKDRYVRTHTFTEIYMCVHVCIHIHRYTHAHYAPKLCSFGIVNVLSKFKL